MKTWRNRVWIILFGALSLLVSIPHIACGQVGLADSSQTTNAPDSRPVNAAIPAPAVSQIHTQVVAIAAEHADALLRFVQQAKQPLLEEGRAQVRELIADGAKLDARDASNRTALTYAVLLGDLETVRLLVESGAFVKARDKFHKTPLFYAVEAGRRDIVDYLSRNGDLQSPTPLERKERQRR